MNENRFAKDARAAMLEALRNRRGHVFVNKRDSYGRTLAGGEAAFHALILHSQTGDLPKNSDEGSVEIPRWVFNELVSAWQQFLLFGSSDDKGNRKTLGQVVGVEPIVAGGREGASLSLKTWDELRVYALAMSISRECDREGLTVSKEELAGNVSDLLANKKGSDFPNVSDATINRYLKKYRKKAK